MARVKDFRFKEIEKVQDQGLVEATYSSFELAGERFFQIDTYGSATRQLTGKRSQSVRLDRDAARVPVALLKQEFSL